MSGTVQSIERAAAVLRLLADESRHLRLVDISHSLDLPKGTVHGILRTLLHVGFVEQERGSGRYTLSPSVHLQAPPLDPHDLRSCAINWADTLAARTGSSVRLGTLSPTGARVVHHVFRPDDSDQVVETGRVLPPHACALGKALLAHAPGGLAQWLPAGGLSPYTPRTVTDVALLERELSHVRRRGWAHDAGELEADEAGVAAPLRGLGGRVVGAIAVGGRRERVLDGEGQPQKVVLSAVQAAAAAISDELVAVHR